MLIGYARTSTTEQAAGLDAQLRDLRAAGCKKLYKEQVSSVVERTQLNAALDYAREGDTLVVTKLDRLARSARHLLELVETPRFGDFHSARDVRVAEFKDTECGNRVALVGTPALRCHWQAPT